MLSTEKYLTSLPDFNDTECVYENSVCIHQKLEETAKKYPENIAVSFNNRHLNYLELNNLSNSLANKLINEKVQVEDFILVYLDRSLELMVSIFGILKAGAVYVPTNKDIPALRLDSILEDTKAKFIITSKALSSNLPDGCKTILIDDFINQTYLHDDTPPLVNVSSKNLAYAIFTSGTTGTPKGVLIEHHSVMNRIGWMQKQYPINEKDVLLQKTSITFDVSIWELFWWSFTGARLCLLPENHEKNPEKLFNTVQKEGVTVIHFVPSMLNVSLSFLKSNSNKNFTKSLRWIFSSGEALMSATVNDFYSINKQKLSNNGTLINLYGPTEATVDVSYFNCKSPAPDVIPIGKPIDNTQLYVIDSQNKVLPFKREGELVICGVNLARGYLNRDDLTKEKFIDILVDNQTIRAYKTGDRALIDSNGDVIYMGRLDHQVKLRGFRIELMEIENVAIQHKEMEDCACILINEGSIAAEIICYYTCPESDINRNAISAYLSDKLPAFMIPTQFIKMNSMPRLSNGKIDKKLLYTYNSVNNMVVKQEERIEDKIKRIWSELLKKDIQSLNDNFFDLGGNSIMVIQMAMQIKKEMNINIDVITLFQFSTIQSLVSFIQEKVE